MSLKLNQVSLDLGTLYAIGKIPNSVEHRIWFDAGTVDVYGSDSATQPTSLSAMTLDSSDTGVSGSNEILSDVHYIAIDQSTGTTSEIVLTGYKVEDLGAIS